MEGREAWLGASEEGEALLHAVEDRLVEAVEARSVAQVRVLLTKFVLAKGSPPLLASVPRNPDGQRLIHRMFCFRISAYRVQTARIRARNPAGKKDGALAEAESASIE